MKSAAASSTPARLTEAAWLTRAETQAVFRALAAGGHDARAVGGAVRNALLGLAVKDIDIATTALPDETMRLAVAAGLAAHPTGLAHGTITVVSNHVPYEVTTLRRDDETDGRHARVVYTCDWAEDAARRDFTINALYCDAAGNVHDPLGGYPDLVARRVRFIGDPHARIREDFLRILRFFRFAAEYAGGVLDQAGLDACRSQRAGLGGLSGERVHSEMLRLLATPAAAAVVAPMAEAGIIEASLNLVPDVRLFQRLVAIEAATGRGPDALLRLGALAGGEPQAMRQLTRRLKLSNAESARLSRAAEPSPAASPDASLRDARVLIYRCGADGFRDKVLFHWMRSRAAADDTRYRERLDLTDRWQAPAMPYRGADLIARGAPPGPAIGRTLDAFEAWWLDADFPSDPRLLETKLEALIGEAAG